MGQPTVVEQIDADLQVPWSTVFLPDGTAVISERESALLGPSHPVAAGRAGTIGKVPDVVPDGEGGLLGLALSPDFATDRYLYAYFTAASDNRIARLRLEERAGAAAAGGLRRSSSPAFPRHPPTTAGGSGSARTATCMSAPATRSAAASPRTRTPSAARSCASRPRDGRRRAIRSATTRSTALATGMSRDLAWDSAGRLWASEFGPDVDDELNLIVPGGNYGWPDVTGAPHRAGFLDAKVVWPSTADSSPSGLEIVGDTAYLGALRGQRLWAVPLERRSRRRTCGLLHTDVRADQGRFAGSGRPPVGAQQQQKP